MASRNCSTRRGEHLSAERKILNWLESLQFEFRHNQDMTEAAVSVFRDHVQYDDRRRGGIEAGTPDMVPPEAIS
jgi:hypothetical protein